ncbi:MAG: AAA family ATPase, partial [Clostridia bacterium]|nr:AAA family ATPase [Clostridia bacterium]
VNTIYKHGGKLIGDNTDILGFLAMADRAGISLTGKHAVVFGSGGTSKTARAALQLRGAASVTVVSRQGEWNYENVYTLAGTQVLVNTTPVGMYPNVSGMPVDPARFPSLEGVIDVVYNPLRTRLCQRAEELGIRCVGGLYMLLAQGRYAAEHFLDAPIADETVERAYRALLAEKRSIVLCGMPGSGKTTLASILAARSGRALIDTDQMIEQAVGMPCGAYITRFGEAAFRDRESECVRKACLVGGGIVATGGGAILREENRKDLRMNGMVFLLRRDLDRLPTDGRPLSKDLETLKQMAQAREASYFAAMDMEIDNNGDPEAAADQIMEAFACAYL